MTSTRKPALDLAETYLHVQDGPAVVPLDGGPAFWATIEQRTDVHDGRLVCVCRQTETWPTWEIHPAGDEVVCLLSGAVDFVLEEPGGERIVPLRNRDACVVPRGTWHRAIVHEPGDVLFITRGAGTTHRPV